jgi:hypothetical protein
MSRSGTIIISAIPAPARGSEIGIRRALAL